MKGHGKQEDQSMPSKTGGPGKFVVSKSQVSRAHNSVSQASTNVPLPASSVAAPPISSINANNGSNGGTSTAQDNNTTKPAASSDIGKKITPLENSSNSCRIILAVFGMFLQSPKTKIRGNTLQKKEVNA